MNQQGSTAKPANFDVSTISPDDIAADLRPVIARWRSDDELMKSLGALSRLRSAHAPDHSIEWASRAFDVLASGSPQSTAEDVTAHFCLVTKLPHASSVRTVAFIIARLLAFGIAVHDVRPIGARDDIAQILYPAAHRYFAGLPSNNTTWDLLAREFGNQSFERIFGIAYSRDLVITGQEAMERFSLPAAELTAIWETGRKPVSREYLASHYGGAAATAILGDQPSYQWFRGKWPLGIHRIAPGVMAFALRHERLGAGPPVIILNGHFPGLAELFSPRTAVINAGISREGPHIRHIRQWLTGHDNRPSACHPGTIRRDAYDQIFPVDSDIPVDSRRNVLHCSDGLLAGMIESRSLFTPLRSAGALASELRSRGLTDGEIASIVAADPIVSIFGERRRLTQLTEGQALTECTDTVLRLVPPVFGAANGYASGLTITTMVRELERAAIPEPKANPHRPLVRTLSSAPVHPASLPADDEVLGRQAIGESRTGFVVPAGGTGGRFGGYDIAESDIRRQKALLPCFTLSGLRCSALDIRVANAAFWHNETGGALPVAVMGSPTNYSLLQDWQKQREAPGLAEILLYRQFGAYRVTSRPALPPTMRHTSWWVDEIVRHGDGTPSLKPPGNLGTLTCLALSGILNTWSDSGIEYLVIANGDDVGFRLDPRIIGFMRRHGDTDAVVTAVPWGLQGEILTDAGAHQVRADASGWCQVQGLGTGTLRYTGQPAPEVVLRGKIFPLHAPSFDVGGRLSEIAAGGSWRIGAVEASTTRALDPAALLSTNQIYLRTSSLKRVMNVSDDHDVAEPVCRFVGSQSFQVERKLVTAGDSKIEAMQLSQAISSVFPRLTVTPMQISRGPRPGQYGGYAPLKTDSDIAFGQLMLEGLAGLGDQLSPDVT